MPDDTSPATKADLQVSVQKLENSIQKIENTVQKLGDNVHKLENSVQKLGTILEKGMQTLHEADDQILTVLINVDKRLTGRIEDHETRIVHLEKAVA